ncbi:MAG: hypothetical protein JWQ76_2173 [Ramlibacter sp.]|nr:hypothetical protein [Ramlibacter sp.]
MAASRANASRAEVLERGRIYFFYRPKVDRRQAGSLDDVARFYAVTHAQRKRKYRLIVIGEKRLPGLARNTDRKTWGFVERVATRAELIEDELDPETYATKTRGVRQVPAAQPVGEGVYAIVRHGDHTHLAYALQLPPEPGEVQRAFNVRQQASFVLSVKNPDAPSPPGLGLDRARRAKYPGKLRELFGERRFIDADPPELLDYEGAEILLVGATADIGRELGLELPARRSGEARTGIVTPPLPR